MDKTLQSFPSLNFPKDHGWHEDTGYEWFYIWGRRENGEFYHHAEFKLSKGVFTHHSEAGSFGEIQTINPIVHLERTNPIIIHRRKPGSFYYTIPGNPWIDHEWGDGIVGGDWDWVGINMGCGMSIMAYNKGEEGRGCDVTLGNRTIESEFILDGKIFFIQETGQTFLLEPINGEYIFKPKIGRPYSETPVNVVSDGRIIGYGMRERTYKKGRV